MQQDQRSSDNDLPLAQRRRLLDHLLEQRLSQRRWRLEFYSETSASVARGRPVQHWLHALLSIATGGIWLIVWLFAVGFEDERREMVYVHPSGFAEVRRLR